MKLNEMDLVGSLEWLHWTEKAHAEGSPQESIDARAFHVLEHLGPTLSMEIFEIYSSSMIDAFDNPALGRPEECMTSACRAVIQMATEKDWDEYASCRTDDWRPIWDSVRDESRSRLIKERRVNALAAGMTREEQMLVLDAGCCNDAILGYLILAMPKEAFGERLLNSVLTEMKAVIEHVPAEEAASAYTRYLEEK